MTTCRTLLLALLAAPACAPVVMHPPRTDPGVFMGWTIGVAAPSDSVLRLAMLPLATPYLRVADRADNGWGGSATMAFNLGAVAGVQGDAYVEVPSRASGWAHGAGLTLGGNFAMPYVQIGRQDTLGSGWYTTHSYTLRGFQPESGALFDGGSGGDVRPRYWTSTITARRARRYEAVEAYASLSLGSYTRRTFAYHAGGADTALHTRPMWTATLGVSVEAELTRLARDISLPGFPGRPRRPPPTPNPIPRP